MGTGVDPLEAAAGKQSGQRVIGFCRVCFDEADGFLFESSESFGDQQSAESLSTVVFDDVDVGEADGSRVPLGDELIESDECQ